jgi:NADPH-dependent curcumin reductase CurA
MIWCVSTLPLIDDARCSAEFQHVEVPIPSPKKGEVLIRMEATSINAVDWKFQNGIARPFMPRRFPFISGNNMQSHAAGPFSPLLFDRWPLQF